ncbi:hypothetical protein [Actinoplanes sp. G11-F43]|uniref:hypothetical protein n=1 Tax=Actinoplanes sp. G11-F43 TaxID=3424130 RepID=UPI003D33EB5B
MTDADGTVRRLYEAPPDGFVTARSAAVEAARAAGDRDTARRIAALKKPTVAAWIVNLVALRRPELLDELAEIAEALRAAQRDLRGDQMRELSQHRRRFVTTLVEAARKLAVEAGAAGGKLPLAEVEATVTAALAEPEIAAQIRTGRLIRAVSYAGFGEVPRPRLRLITGDDESSDPAPASTPDPAPASASTPTPASASASISASVETAEQRRRRRELEREFGSAEAAERRADAQLRRAEDAERDAEHLVEDLDTELAELERRRAAAVAEVARRKQARRTAERQAAEARRRVGDAQAALDEVANGH